MTVLKWMKFSEEGYATNTKARTHIEEGILDIWYMEKGSENENMVFFFK